MKKNNNKNNKITLEKLELNINEESKKSLKDKDNKDNKWILIIILVATLALIVYFISPYTNRHDTSFHLTNIIELKNRILDNGIFSSSNSIIGNIANNFGYGTRIFYPILAHLPTAILDILISDVTISIKIIHYITLILSGITMYYFTKKVTKNTNCGGVSAVIYMLSSYHLSEIYIRDAIGESLIFVFVPLIFLSIYNLFYDNSKNFYILFILGFVGAILSHANMVLYLSFILAIFLLINYKKLFIKENFIKLLIGTIITLLITSFFWMPMLEAKIYGNYVVFQEGSMATYINSNGLNPLSFIYPIITYGCDITFSIDIVVIIMLLIVVYKYYLNKKNSTIEKNIVSKENKFIKTSVIVGIITMFMATFVFPWDILPISFRIIQFPWRMVTYSGFFISLIASLCVKNIKETKKIYVLIVLISLSSILPLVISLGMNGKYIFNYDQDQDIMNLTLGMGWQKEYLPENTLNNIEYFDNRNNEVINIDNVLNNEDSDTVILVDNVPYLQFTIQEEGTYELPRLYYLGYTLLDENGNVIEIWENENGFIECELLEGTYVLDYTGSNIYNISVIVSIAGILLAIIIVINNKKTIRKEGK